MPPAVLFLKNRFVAASADFLYYARIALLIALHLYALRILFWLEDAPDAQLAFVLSWGLLNCFWLTLLRRPATSAALSLAMILILIELSQFKQNVLMLSATFVDVMLIDLGTFSFLLATIPGLAWKVGLGVGAAVLVLVLLWRSDLFRVRRSIAAAGFVSCFAALVTLSLAVPMDQDDDFSSMRLVSKFMRSGAAGVYDLLTRGVFEADAAVTAALDLSDAGACPATKTLPHIVLVFDESSFDATMMPGVKVPPNYQAHFRSLDGKQRSFIVEGAGGPSWFAEYNVLAGLSVRSYGRFAQSAPRLATGRVNRGLAFALRRCGYKTYSLYSWFGAFVGARNFQTATGIENFLDADQLKVGPADTDTFYYNKAIDVLAREHKSGPVFTFVYLAMNHFPWDYRYRPDLLPDWKDLNDPHHVDEYIQNIDEYLRRQEISAREYLQFKERLSREFPGEQFLIVRFGDHQPLFSKFFLEPKLTQDEIAQRIIQRDRRYFTTYYAIDGVNFRPRDMSSALDTLDAPHLPLVVLEGAGVPLEASFREQKKILQRCKGEFYSCADGAEARRFNRLLIDAGLLKF